MSSSFALCAFAATLSIFAAPYERSRHPSQLCSSSSRQALPKIALRRTCGAVLRYLGLRLFWAV